MLSKQPFFDLLRQGSGTLLAQTMPQLLGVRIARKRSRNQPFDVVKLAGSFSAARRKRVGSSPRCHPLFVSHVPSS